MHFSIYGTKCSQYGYVWDVHMIKVPEGQNNLSGSEIVDYKEERSGESKLSS